MTITNSTMMMDMVKKAKGPRLLIVESNVKALCNHIYMLMLNDFTVTHAEKASSGMARILNGDTFDCILVDVDKSEMVMVDFLRLSLRRLPQVYVIVMGANDIRRWICKDAEEYKVVSFLPKPCGFKEIFDMLKHIFKDRMVFLEDATIEKLIQEHQERNFFSHRFCTLFKQSATLNSTMNRNNIPFINGAHQGLNINYLEQVVRSKPVAYVDLTSDDDESSLKENIWRRTTNIQDKGKKPMEQKRKKYQPYEYEAYLRKCKEFKTRTSWTSSLQDIKETLIGFDEKKAYRNTSLKQNNMPAGLLDYYSTVSYLQEHKEIEKRMEPSVVTWMQEGNNFQEESNGSKRFGLSIPSDNHTSILEAGYPEKQPLKLNSAGASFMDIENIKAKLSEAPPFSLSQQTTSFVDSASGYIPDQPLIVEASINNSGFGLVENPHTGTDQHIETQTIQAGYINEIEPLVTVGDFSQPVVEEEMAPSVADVLGESQLDLGIPNAYNYSNDFDSTNYLTTGDINVSEALAPIDCFGLLVETSVTGVGGVIEASPNDGLEDLTFLDRENLFDDADPNSKTLPLGHQNPSFSNPSIPGEEVNTEEADTLPPINSILPYDGSEGRVIDEDWYTHLIHHDHI